MRLPTDTFSVIAVNRNDPYLDIAFGDAHPRALMREWVLTFDGEDNEWYAILCRSETDEDGFEYSFLLPAKVTAQLVDRALEHLSSHYD